MRMQINFVYCLDKTKVTQVYAHLPSKPANVANILPCPRVNAQVICPIGVAEPASLQPGDASPVGGILSEQFPPVDCSGSQEGVVVLQSLPDLLLTVRHICRSQPWPAGWQTCHPSLYKLVVAALTSSSPAMRS